MDRDPNLNNPCVGVCTEGSATCHRECEAYLRYRAELLAAAEDRQKRTEASSMMRNYHYAKYIRLTHRR